MSVVYIVLPLALLLALVGVLLFAWAVRRGQFDDLETPAVRILDDDDGPSRRSGGEARDTGSEQTPPTV